MKQKVILDLCGGTGAWSAPYRRAGYDVRLITLPDNDVRTWARQFCKSHSPWPIHGILAAPPCDHFSVSGAQYWPAKDKDGRTKRALDVVDACMDIILEADPKWWALENPVGRLRALRGRLIGEPTLIFNPCDYGDAYTKKTLLFGNFQLPARKPVKPIRVCAQGSWIQKLGGKSDRTKELRAITPPGFAWAFFRANP